MGRVLKWQGRSVRGKLLLQVYQKTEQRQIGVKVLVRINIAQASTMIRAYTRLFILDQSNLFYALNP